MTKKSRAGLFSLSMIAPGILVAATGVGAGDLVTGALAGSAIGLTILWAAVVGSILKWFLNEGIARWQMATGTTLLEGWVEKLGRWIRWVFLLYLIPWSAVTGGALVSACGIAGTGLCPLSDDLHISKIIWGIIHSLVGAVLVYIGGFKLFEKLMSGCIALMFIAVLLTMFLSDPDWSKIASGVVTPTIPPGSLGWILSILGGVGGTVTLLSYGYWIREEKREGAAGWHACRLDLAVGYSMTAIFGVAMLTIGSGLKLEGKGAQLAITLADQLGSTMGPIGKWIFLLGFWGAVFSSLLGVWQSIPYLFADFMSLKDVRNNDQTPSLSLSKTAGYRAYLVGLTFLSLPFLWGKVAWVQITYAVMGSVFMPLLALTLLILNNRREWVGNKFRNGILANIVLIATVCFFAYVAFDTIYAKLVTAG